MSGLSLEISKYNPITLEGLRAFSRNPHTQLSLSRDPEFLGELAASRQLFAEALAAGKPVYGATTGFGASSHQRLPSEKAPLLQASLVRYHGCGVGPALREEQCAAVLLVRLNCLARCASAVSADLLYAIEGLLQKRLFPVIPALGSVGASGDLTPLSYVAAALCGEREVYDQGQRRPAVEALRQHGLSPYRLEGRDGLALMNGSSVMSAVGGLALSDARTLADRAAELTGLIVELLGAQSSPFVAELHAVKPHPGQGEAAAHILNLVDKAEQRLNPVLSGEARPIQDCYSIRCAPQVIGTLYDALAWAETLLTREINSVNDNPVFLPAQNLILNGGLFFGGHVALACDTVKTAVINVVNLMDRQLALLMEPQRNAVLPENLVAAASSNVTGLSHGFKAMQITMSALAAEALKNALPASVLSRPTEASNQDVVSMGSIAARDLDHVLGLAQAALAIHGMAIRQGFFALESRGLVRPLNGAARGCLARVAEASEPVTEDRSLDLDIAQVARVLMARPWSWA